MTDQLTDDERQRCRIDFFKVKQKVLDSYPLNSLQRQSLIKQEKLRELQELTVSENITSTPELKVSVKTLIRRFKFNIFKIIIGLFVMIIGEVMLFYSKSLLEFSILWALILFGAFFLGVTMYNTYLDYTTLTRYIRVVKEIKNKIQKLKQDILS